jgi:hypothetical protein
MATIYNGIFNEFETSFEEPKDLIREFSSYLFSKERYKPLQKIFWWSYDDEHKRIVKRGPLIVNLTTQTPNIIITKMASADIQSGLSFISPDIPMIHLDDIIAFLKERKLLVEIVEV